MEQNSAKYYDGDSFYHADTCEPVKEAIEKGSIKLQGLAKSSYPGTVIPDNFLTGMVSLGYWDIGTKQNWHLDWHRNEGIEFTLLDQGGVNFTVNNEEFNLEPINLTVTRPWQQHRVGYPNVTASRLHWIIIDVQVRQPHTEWTWPEWIVLSNEELRDLTERLRGNETPVWNSSQEIHQSFLKIKKETDNFNLDTSETKLKLLINELLMHIYSLFKASEEPLKSSNTSARRTAKLFLEDLPNHLEVDWTLENMAGHCHMGRTQFSTLCAEITNLTPMKFLLKCKIEKAEQLLSYKELPVTEVAYQSGFNNSQYLSTQFKKMRGITPREFRHLALKNNAPAS